MFDRHVESPGEDPPLRFKGHLDRPGQRELFTISRNFELPCRLKPLPIKRRCTVMLSRKAGNSSGRPGSDLLPRVRISRSDTGSKRVSSPSGTRPLLLLYQELMSSPFCLLLAASPPSSVPSGTRLRCANPARPNPSDSHAAFGPQHGRSGGDVLHAEPSGLSTGHYGADLNAVEYEHPAYKRDRRDQQEGFRHSVGGD